MTTTAGNDRDTAFVDYLFRQCANDRGFAARLRRADNPATEYQSWGVLARFEIDIESDSSRLPYATIAAAVGKAVQSGHSHNGALGLGKAILSAFPDASNEDKNSPAHARLRRLLACDDVAELCVILRPLLSLILSRVSQPLDYVKLLEELHFFNQSGQRIKARWAQQFYGKAVDAPLEGNTP